MMHKRISKNPETLMRSYIVKAPHSGTMGLGESCSRSPASPQWGNPGKMGAETCPGWDPEDGWVWDITNTRMHYCTSAGQVRCSWLVVAFPIDHDCAILKPFLIKNTFTNQISNWLIARGCNSVPQSQGTQAWNAVEKVHECRQRKTLPWKAKKG